MKMEIGKVLKMMQSKIVKNAPKILTGVTVTGTIGASVSAARAGVLSGKEILLKEQELGRTLTAKEKFELVWTNYILSTILGGVTVTSAIAAAVMQNRRIDAISAVLAGTQQFATDIQEAVINKIGEKRYTDVRDDACRKKVEENPITQTTCVATGNGDSLMYESISGRYFTSDIESVRRAANDFQADIIGGISMSNSLNAWYDALDLPRIRLGEDVGWNLDNPLKVRFSTTIAVDGRPCIVVDYLTMPTDRFNQFY